EELDKEFKKLRIHARNQVIILIFSLILVFLWFTFFSWILNTQTFSREASYYAAQAVGLEINFIVPITFFFAFIFTVFYILILRKLAPKIKEFK
ncbi:MAG: hypothetical protein ACFFDN_49325, partial [Candidatus Hodarchaeota archaeon]